MHHHRWSQASKQRRPYHQNVSLCATLHTSALLSTSNSMPKFKRIHFSPIFNARSPYCSSTAIWCIIILVQFPLCSDSCMWLHQLGTQHTSGLTIKLQYTQISTMCPVSSLSQARTGVFLWLRKQLYSWGRNSRSNRHGEAKIKRKKKEVFSARARAEAQWILPRKPCQFEVTGLK